jgi:hypothetical protein
MPSFSQEMDSTGHVGQCMTIQELVEAHQVSLLSWIWISCHSLTNIIRQLTQESIECYKRVI